jgi:hypothetical protein
MLFLLAFALRIGWLGFGLLLGFVPVRLCGFTLCPARSLLRLGLVSLLLLRSRRFFRFGRLAMGRTGAVALRVSRPRRRMGLARGPGFP